MPKTWTTKEVLDLIEQEIREAKLNARNRNLPAPSPAELSALILARLDGEGLVECVP